MLVPTLAGLQTNRDQGVTCNIRNLYSEPCQRSIYGTCERMAYHNIPPNDMVLIPPPPRFSASMLIAVNKEFPIEGSDKCLNFSPLSPNSPIGSLYQDKI